MRGNDLLRLLVEPRRGLDIGEVGRGIVAGVQKTFEMTPEIVILESGTLGKEFEVHDQGRTVRGQTGMTE